MDYQVVLAGEMVLLITGETGIAMIHGWTEGASYMMRQYYTPMWTCAALMVLIFLLILSLFFVFVGLHFNRPGIIKHHVMALAVSWPLAMCIIVGGIASGAPFLVGFVIFLYFCSLLPFAYIYGSAEWKATELPSPHPSSVSKGPLFLLAIIQIVLALISLLETLITILINPQSLRHMESKAAMFVIFVLDATWLSTTLLLIVGVLRNQYKLLRPHFYSTPILLLVELLIFALLLFAGSITHPIVMCAITIAVMSASLYHEWKFADNTLQ